MKLSSDQISKYVEEKASKFSKTYINESTKLLTKTEVVTNQMDTDTWMMIGILYKVTHFNHDNYLDTSNYQPIRKRSKRNYDRIFSFGDLEGGTFAVITNNAEQSKSMMFYNIEEIAPGTPFALINTKNSEGATLRLDMPVVKCEIPFIPLKTSIYDILPSISPINPEPGETTFFLLKYQQLKFFGAHLVGKGDVIPTSCTGFFCDRMNRFKSRNEACGCFHRNNIGNFSSVVLESDIILQAQEETFKVFNHRSLRTTLLYMINIDEISTKSREVRELFRSQFSLSVKNCTQYFNENGGFTVSGVITRGNVFDESNNNQLIGSCRPTHYFCFIHPTKHSIVGDTSHTGHQFDPKKHIIVLDDNNEKNSSDVAKMPASATAQRLTRSNKSNE